MIIPEHKVEEVRAASDVVDVVSDYVRLKKRGSNYFGLCPFHNEKTPSFSVNPSMGIYKCFGCGKGGNVFQFVMEMEAVGFPEAVRMLAERAGIPLPEQDDEREHAGEIESIYHALRFAARFFYDQLTQTQAGRPALDYLTGRGFTPKTIKQFGLGYAPDAWDALLKAAEANHVAPETLEKAGLVLPRKDGNGHYDRFRDRVVFPIFSHVGKVLGFGGRILRADPEQPKYINSPETKVYNKSRVLYGLYQAKQAVRKSEEAILVEGYTDVMALHQAGVENVVASSGTALTEEQIKTLGRYARRVLLLYDADAAGAGAALRGIDLVLEQGLSAYAVALPGGEDPDSFVRQHGADSFSELVRAAKPLSEFLLQELETQVDLSSTDGRSRLTALVGPLLEKLPHGVYRELLLARLAELVRIAPDRLESLLTAPAAAKPRTAPLERPAARNPLVRKAITLVLHHPAAARELADLSDLDYVKLPGIELLRRLLEVSRSNPQITTAGLEERFREDPEGRFLSRLAGEPPIDDEKFAPAVLRDNLARLVEVGLKGRQDALIRQGGALSETQRAELADIGRRLSAREAR